MVHDFKAWPELTNNQMDFYYFESPHKQITDDFSGRVVKVHDGDTITMRTDFRDFDFPVRLLYIGAPEIKQDGGVKSRNWLADKILNEDVEVLIKPNNRIEKWGRLLGIVLFNGMSMNQASLDAGESIDFEDVGGIYEWVSQ